jgi:hypothetical protein
MNQGDTTMDTIQVDAKKLQLLNDRINQTIDALNQLRVTAQAGVGLGHSTLGAPVSPYAQFAAAFGQGVPAVPGVYGFQQGLIDPSIVARQQAMQALMAQWAMGGLGHSTLPQGGFAPTYAACAAPGYPAAYAASYPAAYAAQAYPGVYGVQPSFWGAGLGHTTVRSPAAELICGVCDPSLRQAEVARACEANRAWEVSQGLGHTTLPINPASIYGANPFVAACGPFTTVQSPWVNGFANASMFGC